MISIGTFAEKFDVSLRTVRYYEAHDLLSPQRESRKRSYSERDEARMRMVMRLKHCRFTIEEIRDMYPLDSEEPPLPPLQLVLEQRVSLERLRDEITDGLALLQEMEARHRDR